ncbi:MAG TPA: hypothetical protein VM431_13460 [Phycisphaerae bacterium]|nr:hypothetical protein [Phycisphaerae bacterium]
MRHASLAMAAMVLAAAGCAAMPKADRDATPVDLAVAAETIGEQPEGGLPAQVRVTVRNRSEAVVALTLPRPLAALVEPAARDELPLPLLVLVLADAEGHDEMPIYSDPRAKRWAKARVVALAPGQEWSATYAIEDFYFWGPSGPDTGGSFAKYFWRGDREITMRAALFYGEGKAVRSAPVTVRCKFEDWLFRRQKGSELP